MEYNFRFDELAIDIAKVTEVLGYSGNVLPEPFDSYLETALNEAAKLTDIKGTYVVINDISIDYKNYILYSQQHKFNLGKAVCNEIKGSDQIAFYVSTAGKTISERSADLLSGEDPVLGYIFDVLGSLITEAASDQLHSLLQNEISKTKDKLTNRYSPGYCHWPVDDQFKLFYFFPENICGVRLTDSALMNPVKSVSGIIGIGKNVKYRKYICRLCISKNCIYRKLE